MPRYQEIPAESRAKSKLCISCSEVKAASEFYVNTARPDGLSVYCVPCHKNSHRQYERNERQRVLELLGGCCARCGFKDARALQIDHIEGNGHRDRLKNGWRSPLNAILRGDRKTEFQLLCANCNVIKRLEAREFRKAESYTRAVAHERTFKGWKNRPPRSEESRRKTSASLKRAYAEGRHSRHHSTELGSS